MTKSITTPRPSVQRVEINLPEAVNKSRIITTAEGQSHQRISEIVSGVEGISFVMFSLLSEEVESSTG
jgi:hypothetical protein